MLSRRFALLALPLLAAALVAAAPASAQQADDSDQRSITVSGDGEVFGDNDVAVFRFSATTRRRTAGAALRANSAAMRRITAAVRTLGVAERDVRTDVVSLGRVTIKKRTRYVARNAIAVTIRDLDDAGRIVDAAVHAGATGVGGPEFGLADPSALYRDALALAFGDARAKAERLAREAGVTLGGVLRIQEGGVEVSFDESERSAAGAPAPQSVPIQPGRSQVSASVTVSFAIS